MSEWVKPSGRIRAVEAIGTTIRHVVEHSDKPWDQADVAVVHRDWDVTDPKARDAAAEAELGELDHHWEQHATWYINAKTNAAALAVHRPKVRMA